jgi:hypothetical protein
MVACLVLSQVAWVRPLAPQLKLVEGEWLKTIRLVSDIRGYPS